MDLILLTIIFIFIAVVLLAIIGYFEKRKQERWLRDYNEKSIKTFMDAQSKRKQSLKRKRQRTPKVPSIK